jgi:hypothetical protein
MSFVGHPVIHVAKFVYMLLHPRCWHCGYEPDPGRSFIGGTFHWCLGGMWFWWIGPFWIGLVWGSVPAPGTAAA